jgi:hypothetical protein
MRVRRVTVVAMRVTVSPWLNVVFVVTGKMLVLLVRTIGCLRMVTLIRISKVFIPRFRT